MMSSDKLKLITLQILFSVGISLHRENKVKLFEPAFLYLQLHNSRNWNFCFEINMFYCYSPQKRGCTYVYLYPLI